MSLVEGVDHQRRAFVGLGSIKQGLLMFTDAVSIDEVNCTDFLDLAIFVDVSDCSLGELGHVQNSALLFVCVIAHPVEEVELWIDGELGTPLTND